MKKNMIGLTVAVTVLTLVAGGSKRIEADTSWCPSGQFNPNSGDFYPGTAFYPSGSVSSDPWFTPDGRGAEYFSSYADGALIESRSLERRLNQTTCLSNCEGLRTHLEMDSGDLYAKHIDYDSRGQYVGWRRAFTSTYDFRVLAVGKYGGKKVKWTDGTVEAKFYVDAWQPTSEPFQGVHLYGHYRSDDDNYAVSLRRDNLVTIKKEVCHQYTTLASGTFHDADGSPRTFQTKRWYTLKLRISGSTLSFYVDGVLQLQVSDSTFSWGTFGIRTDYANVYLDDLLVY